MHRRCYRQLRPFTDPTREAKKAKADKAGAVVPEATVNCGQKKKEKTFGTWRGGSSNPSRPTSGWRRILIKMGNKKLVECEDERQAAMVGLQTKFVKQLGVKNRLGDCGVDSSLPATRRSTS